MYRIYESEMQACELQITIEKLITLFLTLIKWQSSKASHYNWQNLQCKLTEAANTSAVLQKYGCQLLSVIL